MVDFLADPPAENGGYVFEAALCLVDSQSPLLRPTIEEHEAHVRLSWTRTLTRLVAGVRGHLDAEDWRRLLDAAGRVAGGD